MTLNIFVIAEDRKERERELVSAEMIPTAVTQLTFWEKFAELQYKMIAHAPDAPHGHMFASEPSEWPLLVRSIAYWLSPNSNVRILFVFHLPITFLTHQLTGCIFTGSSTFNWESHYLVHRFYFGSTLHRIPRPICNSTSTGLYRLTSDGLTKILRRRLHFVFRLLDPLPPLLFYGPHIVSPSLFTRLHF